MNGLFFVQVFKYGLVGLLNTAITALVIGLMMWAVFGLSMEDHASGRELFISNIVGYLAGLINGFLMNRRWTFKSNVSLRSGATKFLLAFAICYPIQYYVVSLLNSNGAVDSYFCQLFGMLVYTALNFLLNKYYTFR
ncbi:polysaccharide synthesis protein GtrA [Bacteroidales bacterium]|nr:polysaccharide synthesis protein GtrA [Bacteroidales bacterium]